MSRELTIRPAVQEDAPAIAAVIRSIGWFAWMKDQDPHTIDARICQHMALCLQDRSHSVYVAESECEIAGYVSVHWNPYLIQAGPEGYVSELFITEARRGEGVGARLLNAVEQEARSRGCSRLLLLNVRQRESYLRGFYRKHGWIEWEDAAVFVYPLEP